MDCSEGCTCNGKHCNTVQPLPGQNIPERSYPYGPPPYLQQQSNYQPNTIISQPRLQSTPNGWMTIPTGIVDCPPGLEYLASIDQLLVHQKVELLEAFTGFQTNNRYIIRNTMGQNVYWAIENTDCCTRNCCGAMRPFNMKVMDAYQQEVIHFYRPLACASCCFPCCLQSIEISAPAGNIIGTIDQEWTLCYPHYSVKNHHGETVLRIEGPLCTFSCGGDVKFKILSLDGTQVGKISKQWSGLAREYFTEADNFGISFPMNLDVRMKAVMLGACILIDMMFFENSGGQRQSIANLAF